MRAWVIALAACSSAPPAPVASREAAMASREQCDRLLSHLVDLEFVKAGVTLKSGKSAVIDSKRDEFEVACMKTSRARIDCALAAPTIDDVAKCDRL